MKRGIQICVLEGVSTKYKLLRADGWSDDAHIIDKGRRRHLRERVRDSRETCETLHVTADTDSCEICVRQCERRDIRVDIRETSVR